MSTLHTWKNTPDLISNRHLSLFRPLFLSHSLDLCLTVLFGRPIYLYWRVRHSIVVTRRRVVVVVGVANLVVMSMEGGGGASLISDKNNSRRVGTLPKFL
ncbi:hypothetical protein L195_g043429 [Trifolium pratense]|uniref:Transmembrane protein n=1 Tax=Trifolium pratense TaxID=57577 RepID=A0A2K3M976_TRIPR|nr:hypothetical protein L195_g043429 [Trifolium pratense]